MKQIVQLSWTKPLGVGTHLKKDYKALSILPEYVKTYMQSD